MNTSDLDYHLPKNLIAQSPVSPRDHSRLMVIDRKTGKIEDHIFYDIVDILKPTDILVLNKTKVFPARFFGKKDSGGKIEVLLVEEIKPNIWKVLTKPGIKAGQKIIFRDILFECVGHEESSALLKSSSLKDNLFKTLNKFGHTPLPPYINSTDSESKLRTKYQTVYAKNIGSVAAPTAGFHFTKELLERLEKKGVQIEYVTLHVGLGTFLPIKTKTLEKHQMHEEHYEIDPKTFERIMKAKKAGKRIIAVGTTSVRVLESLPKRSGYTKIFIYPGYKFKTVDSLITNFHLPHSTLLALVYAFAGEKLIRKAYQLAIKNKYRFYSFGDATFIV